MKFNYVKVYDFPKHQRRERILPWIRFGIFNPKNAEEVLYPVGLVDSGSDVTIIDYEFGERLGYEVHSGQKQKIFGVGGGFITVYFHKVGFLIHDGSDESPIRYQDLVAFTIEKFPPTMPQQTAILGTIGFFRHFRVTFEFPHQIGLIPL